MFSAKYIAFFVVLGTLFPTCRAQGVITVDTPSGTTTSHKLSCYTCSTMADGEMCFHVAHYLRNVSHLYSYCPENHKYCIIQKVSFTVNGTGTRIWSLSRNCSQDCNPNCMTLGERTTKVFVCHSCCTDSLCNVGNYGNIFNANLCVQISLILSLFILVPWGLVFIY